MVRGLAVLAMIVYHMAFDLSVYYGYEFEITTGVPAHFARLTASVFLMLIGICFVISWERTLPECRQLKYMKRALVIFSGAMIVSVVTWLVDPATFVVFGILHLIAVATAFQYGMASLKQWNLLIGISVMSLAFVMPETSITTPLLLPLGIMPQGFISVDYYPLIPWLGPIFIGMGLGHIFYVPERRNSLSLFDAYSWPQWLLWTGRQSLPIYFLHQPVILLILWMLVSR